MQKKINLVKLLKNYGKGWVAISDDFQRVVFSGRTLASTRKKAKKYKNKLYYFPSGEKYSDFFG